MARQQAHYAATAPAHYSSSKNSHDRDAVATRSPLPRIQGRAHAHPCSRVSSHPACQSTLEYANRAKKIKIQDTEARARSVHKLTPDARKASDPYHRCRVASVLYSLCFLLPVPLGGFSTTQPCFVVWRLFVPRLTLSYTTVDLAALPVLCSVSCGP